MNAGDLHFAALGLGLFLLMAGSLGCSDAERNQGEVLRDLIPAPGDLPTGSQLAALPDESEIPFGMTTNPTVSGDRAFIEAYSRELFEEVVAPESISEALFACYEEADEEAGICAFLFEDAAAARAAIRFFAEEEDSERIFHFQKGKLAVIVWRDRVSPELFQFLKDHVTSAL